jgi:ABC-2 type transport system ATP-binding protein
VEATQPMIVAKDLHKSFGKVQALRGLSLSVKPAEIVVLLGPNGAGKTTLVRVLATLLRPDAGSAHVAGLETVAQAAAVRRIIGLASQATAVDEHLTGRENLRLVARLNHVEPATVHPRVDEMLKRIDLEGAADRPAKGYSGGMKRRLDLGMSLIGDPQVVFLDEPTTGLDPPSRIAMWDTVQQLRRQGRTVLLTTQNLEEADRLADRIVVVDKGTIIAEGTSTELKARVGPAVVEVTFDDQDSAKAASKVLKPLGARAEAGSPRLTVPAPHGSKSLADVVRRLDAKDIGFGDISLRRPTLDDVFLALTGHAAESKGDKK